MGIGFLLFLGVAIQNIEGRLPPKFLKVAAGAGKALYARGYGYGVAPVPQQILLHTNLARKEIYSGRPKRGPSRRRPPPHYAENDQKRRPGLRHRPQPSRLPLNYQDEVLEEEFDYDDRYYNEFDDFVTKHSELYVNGFNSKGKLKGRYNDEEADNSELIYVRKPRPKYQSPKEYRTASTKLYSSTITHPSRPFRPKDEEEDDQFDYEDEYNYNHRKVPKRSPSRPKYLPNRFRKQNSRNPGIDVFNKEFLKNWDPDGFYHDRNYVQNRYYAKRLPEDTRFINSENRSPWRQEVPKRWKNNITKVRDWPQQNDFLDDDDDEKGYSNNDQYETKDWRSIRKFNRNPYLQKERDFIQKGLWDDRTVTEDKQDKKKEEEEPDIITSQNAEHWEPDRETRGSHRYNPIQNKSVEHNTFVKEHSVGYGIEIESGKKKRREPSDSDVVYGELRGQVKPRVPDFSYHQETGS